MRFPNNLEGFFASKDGLKTQIGEAVSSDSKAAAEKGSCEKKTLLTILSPRGDFPRKKTKYFDLQVIEHIQF